MSSLNKYNVEIVTENKSVRTIVVQAHSASDAKTQAEVSNPGASVINIVPATQNESAEGKDQLLTEA